MNEREFIRQLQQRADEQKQLLKVVPFPHFFAFIAEWLSHHPWRYLIPLAFIISLLLRFFYGHAYTEFILWLFSRL